MIELDVIIQSDILCAEVIVDQHGAVTIPPLPTLNIITLLCQCPLQSHCHINTWQGSPILGPEIYPSVRFTIYQNLVRLIKMVGNILMESFSDCPPLPGRENKAWQCTRHKFCRQSIYNRRRLQPQAAAQSCVILYGDSPSQSCVIFCKYKTPAQAANQPELTAQVIILTAN